MDRTAQTEKLDKLTSKQKIAIVCGTILAVLALYWFFFFSPSYSKLEDIKKEISQLENKINQKKVQAAKLPKLEKKLRKNKKEMQYARDLLPKSQVGIENLLSQIEKLGKKVGVEFISFVPANESVREFYVTREVKLLLKGPFHNLMTFFNKLSSLNRLVTLESLRLKPRRNPEKTVLRTNSKIFLYRTLTPQEKEAQKNNNQ